MSGTWNDVLQPGLTCFFQVQTGLCYNCFHSYDERPPTPTTLTLPYSLTGPRCRRACVSDLVFTHSSMVKVVCCRTLPRETFQFCSHCAPSVDVSSETVPHNTSPATRRWCSLCRDKEGACSSVWRKYNHFRSRSCCDIPEAVLELNLIVSQIQHVCVGSLKQTCSRSSAGNVYELFIFCRSEFFRMMCGELLLFRGGAQGFFLSVPMCAGELRMQRAVVSGTTSLSSVGWSYELLGQVQVDVRVPSVVQVRHFVLQFIVAGPPLAPLYP